LKFINHVNPALNAFGGFDGVSSVTVKWHLQSRDCIASITDQKDWEMVGGAMGGFGSPSRAAANRSKKKTPGSNLGHRGGRTRAIPN